MPDYPKTTGELVTVKDPSDNQTKLLDTIIQLLRNADASTLETLNNLVTTVSTLSGQAWKNNQTNLPASNNAFDIGSASRMIKSIYSMGMTLGREGYEWEINDTDGYITLPNGILFQFGRANAKNLNGKQTIEFLKPFSSRCLSFQYLQAFSDSNNYTTAQAWTYTYNITENGSITVVTQTGLIYLYWMAIGY